MKGLTFFPVPEFSKVDQAFGASPESYFNRSDLPEVPHEFERMARDLFFKGGSIPDLAEGVDRGKAFAALRAWLSSFAPPHESKMATVAYALWVWTTPEAIAQAKAA